MTTTVKIEAHVVPGRQVEVEITSGGNIVEEFTLQDGETAERHIYDDRDIIIREAIKTE